MNVEATTESPLATGADTIVVGVFEGEDVAHDLPGGALGALLDSGEAQREFKRLAVTHADGRRVILIGLGDAVRVRRRAGARSPAGWRTAARARWPRTRCAGRSPTTSATRSSRGSCTGPCCTRYRFERYKPSEDSRRVNGCS